MPLGRDMSTSLSVDHGNGHTDAIATLQRNVPYDGGWGWQLQAGDHSNDAVGSAIASFRGRYGDAAFGVSRNGGQTSGFASASGSLAWMDGQIFASRRIGDSFAVVSTGGVPNVPVMYENRLFGLSNARGYLLIPDLRGWQRNRIAIDPDRLGANYRLSALEQFAVPADADGILVHFGVEKLQPVVAVLLGPDEKPVPAGTPGMITGKDVDVLVGFDGEAYIENAPAGTVIEMDVGDVPCHYHLPAVGASSGQAKVGPLACERSGR
jgi:outer membrane usher protein